MRREPLDPLLEKLLLAFNGEHCILQDRFVDKEFGMFKLYYNVGENIHHKQYVHTAVSGGC
jgi:hypothetical protein